MNNLLTAVDPADSACVPPDKTATNPIVGGSLMSAVWEMSWPLLTTYLLSSLIGLSDTYISGFISDSAQAAVGIGEQAIFLTIILGTGLSVGTVACVARSIGSGDLELARQYARDSLLISLVVGLLASLAGVLAAKPVFSLLAVDPQVSAHGIRYLEVCALANLPFVVAMCQSAIFRALGKPCYALYLWIVISSLSIALNFALFFGLLPWGKGSVDALSLSWLTGCTGGVVAGAVWLQRLWSAQTEQRSNLRDRQISFVRMRELLSIGGPALIADAVWIISNFLTYKIFAGMLHAAQVQAAWSIAHKVEETCASMPLLALSLAAATIVGQNLGAGQKGRAQRAGWLMAMAALAAMVGIGGLLFAVSEPIAKMLSADKLVQEYTTLLLRLAPLTVPCLALWLVLFGALEGAGCTWTPMVSNVTVLVVVRLPLYWLVALPLGLGLSGLVAPFCLSRALLAAIAVYEYSRGAWLLGSPSPCCPSPLISVCWRFLGRASLSLKLRRCQNS